MNLDMMTHDTLRIGYPKVHYLQGAHDSGSTGHIGWIMYRERIKVGVRKLLVFWVVRGMEHGMEAQAHWFGRGYLLIIPLDLTIFMEAGFLFRGCVCIYIYIT